MAIVVALVAEVLPRKVIKLSLEFASRLLNSLHILQKPESHLAKEYLRAELKE